MDGSLCVDMLRFGRLPPYPRTIPLPHNSSSRPPSPARATTTRLTTKTRNSRRISMVQSLNLPGILAVAQVVRSPSLLLPHIAVPHIGFLDFQALKDAGAWKAKKMTEAVI